jgi:hypothetical protein
MGRSPRRYLEHLPGSGPGRHPARDGDAGTPVRVPRTDGCAPKGVQRAVQKRVVTRAVQMLQHANQVGLGKIFRTHPTRRPPPALMVQQASRGIPAWARAPQGWALFVSTRASRDRQVGGPQRTIMLRGLPPCREGRPSEKVLIRGHDTVLGTHTSYRSARPSAAGAPRHISPSISEADLPRAGSPRG